MTTALPPLTLSESSAALLPAFGTLHLELPALWLVLLVALILLNGFFVAAEVALHRVHSSQLEDAVEEKKKTGAELALRLHRHADPYLATCQIGTTASTLLLGALGEPLLSAWLAPLLSAAGLDPAAWRWLGFLLAILLLTVVQTIVGVQIPRALGYRRAVGASIACARPLRFFYLATILPVKIVHRSSAWLLRRLFKLELVVSSHLNTTEDDLRIMVEETGRAQVVTETEREILENALDLNELCVRDIITPRNEVVDLNVHRTFKENLQAAIESKHTRFPLVDGHLDQTLGLVHLKDLLREMQRDSPNLFAAKRDLLHVSERLPLDELLKLFLARRAHMALVVDEFGGSLGLVTLDDVLDEVVGEINDEFDEEEEPAFRRLDSSSFLVEGWVPLHELADEVEDLELESPDVSTIGGYLTSLFGHIPAAGEQVELEGYLATVVEADERVVEMIRFEKLASPEEDEGGREERDTLAENAEISEIPEGEKDAGMPQAAAPHRAAEEGGVGTPPGTPSGPLPSRDPAQGRPPLACPVGRPRRAAPSPPPRPQVETEE